MFYPTVCSGLQVDSSNFFRYQNFWRSKIWTACDYEQIEQCQDQILFVRAMLEASINGVGVEIFVCFMWVWLYLDLANRCMLSNNTVFYMHLTCLVTHSQRHHTDDVRIEILYHVCCLYCTVAYTVLPLQVKRMSLGHHWLIMLMSGSTEGVSESCAVIGLTGLASHIFYVAHLNGLTQIFRGVNLTCRPMCLRQILGCLPTICHQQVSLCCVEACISP